MTNLSNGVHIFAHPQVRENLIDFFINTLQCKALLGCDVESIPEPIVAFLFSNVAFLSMEFTEDALDEKQARRAGYACRSD